MNKTLSDLLLIESPERSLLYRERIKWMNLMNHSLDLIHPEQFKEYSGTCYSITAIYNDERKSYIVDTKITNSNDKNYLDNIKFLESDIMHKMYNEIIIDPKSITAMIRFDTCFLTFGLYSLKEFTPIDMNIFAEILINTTKNYGTLNDI